MFVYGMQILRQLAVLVVCHDLAVGQIISHYVLLQRPMSWFKAREFCQRHYVDLTVLSTEEQYFVLSNATAANKVSYWLGMQRQSTSVGWKWVSGEELSYDGWYRRNYEGRCASLEAMLKKDKKLLARYCDEMHMFICQGLVSPVIAASVASDYVILSWNVSAVMQMTPHHYNVTMCNNTCDTVLHAYTDGSALMNISISNLTSATAYLIEVSAYVSRPDSVTGRDVTLQSNPTALQVKTANPDDQSEVIRVILKSLNLVYLAPPVWILYHILKKCNSPFLYESKHDAATLEQVKTTEEAVLACLVLEKTRAKG